MRFDQLPPNIRAEIRKGFAAPASSRRNRGRTPRSSVTRQLERGAFYRCATCGKTHRALAAAERCADSHGGGARIEWTAL
jgi:hypothetical protein